MIENKKYIHWMALFGLVVIIGLQGVWLYNSFNVLKRELIKTYNEIFEQSTLEEATTHFKELPKGTRFLGAPRTGKKETFPEATYLFQSLSKYDININLNNLDSIYKAALAKHHIETDFYFLMNKTEKKQRWNVIETKIIPLRIDESQSVQAILLNPYRIILSRMGLLLAATAVMMLFVIFCIVWQVKILRRMSRVIYCIVWQVKILRRMSRVLRIREDFSYAMVHDMKTPLSSIIMTVELLHQGRLDDKPQLRERYFSIAEAEAQHLLALTNKILTLSKLENHRLHLMPEPLPLRPVVEKLAESLAPKCPKPLHISYDLQVETLCADPEFWPEVMQNLLDNAVKYTRPDAEAVEIHVSTRPAGRHTTELRIRDNGRGISRRHLRTIFDKYERASAERGRKSQDGAPAGFGLGLSFVHQVVRAHGGTIRAESEEGKWTEFAIRLPEMQEKEKE